MDEKYKWVKGREVETVSTSRLLESKKGYMNKILLSLLAGQLMEGMGVHGIYEAAKNRPEDISDR